MALPMRFGEDVGAMLEKFKDDRAPSDSRRQFQLSRPGSRHGVSHPLTLRLFEDDQ